MKKTISKSDFRDEFRAYKRQDNFSYEGLGALFDYMEEFDESCGTETKLDVIAFCCEFTEYEDFAELQGNYDVESMDELQNNTTVIDIDGTSFIIQDY